MEPDTPDIDLQLRELDAAELEVWRDDHNRLFVSEGKLALYEDVRAVRAFPLTMPTTAVFIVDSEGKEIGYVNNLERLAPQSRSVLEEELALKYFTTRIRSIIDVKSSHGVTTWELDTERGHRCIHVRDRNDIRRLPGRRAVMTDAHGMKYEIVDSSALDDKSQALFEAES